MPSTRREISMPRKDVAAGKVASALIDFVSVIPTSKEKKSLTPEKDAKVSVKRMATSAAVAAGTLALPVGPLGWLTILPEMLGVWKIQAQLVVDIAAIYGKDATVTQEQMLYCLFRHSSAQLIRDLVVRAGDRFLVRRASLRVVQTIANKLGVKITQRAVGKGLSRWFPIVGAIGVGAYAYYDTAQVGATAIELFEQEIEVE